MYEWPDLTAVLEDFRSALAQEGTQLVVRSMEEVRAGVARATLAADYDPDLDLFALSALLFDALATRHPLRDGNKRLGFQMALDLLSLNGVELDLPQEAVVELCRAVVAGERPVEDLAAFLREHTV